MNWYSGSEYHFIWLTWGELAGFISRGVTDRCHCWVIGALLRIFMNGGIKWWYKMMVLWWWN